MITEEQRAALLQASKDYLAAQQEEVDTFIGNAYAHGRDGIADLAGSRVVTNLLEEDRVAALIDNNFQRIVSTQGRWLQEIQGIVGEGYLRGESPVDIAGHVSQYFNRMPGNWSVIARDQVAKAQLEGRDATYRQIGQSQVEVTVAPDACPECQPHDGRKVSVEDFTARPQFHIQCACMDIPTIDDDIQAEVVTAVDPLEAAINELNELKPFGKISDARAWRKDFLARNEGNEEVRALARALPAWQGNGSGTMRKEVESYLRSGRKPKAATQHLMRAVADAPSNSPTLYRGAKFRYPDSWIQDNFGKGKTHDIGMGSFTQDRSVGEGFTHGEGTGVLFKLKSGSKAVNVEPFSTDYLRLEEREFLSGGRFKVTSIKKKDGVFYVDMEQVDVFRPPT